MARLASLLLLTFASVSNVLSATFTATLDQDTVMVGESATLTLRFEGGQPKGIPTPPAIPNLQMSSRGTQFSTEIVNGRASSSISATFELTPTQPGEFTIPALAAQVDSEVVTSQPLKLKAVKSDSSSNQTAEQLAFFRLAVPKREVFVGEVFQVEFQVYVRDGVANAGRILDSFDAYGGSPIKAEGFTVLKTAHAQRRRVQSGNAIYTFATLVSAVAAAKTGPLTIGSMDVNLTLQIPARNQRQRDPLWDPFGFNQFEQRPLRLEAEPVTVTSFPLPKENVPANFAGAVGSYSVSFTAGPTNVATGDPITVHIQISGRGALDSLNLPEQPAWRDFKSYPPAAKVNTTDPLGIEGSKTFEQVIVPQSANIKELPPVNFSFFDPEQKAYRSLVAPAIKLVVSPTAAAPAPTIASANRPAETPPPTQDIVPIKRQLGVVAQIRPPLVERPWFLAAQAIPILALVSAVVLRKRADSLANNPRLRRRRQVAQIVHDGLKDLQCLAAENKSDEFFGTLFRLLQEQLGERLDLPASAITEAVIDESLRPRRVSEDVLARLQELFQACNLARYAPIKSSQELAALIPKMETTLRELQSLRL